MSFLFFARRLIKGIRNSGAGDQDFRAEFEIKTSKTLVKTILTKGQFKRHRF